MPQETNPSSMSGKDEDRQSSLWPKTLETVERNAGIIMLFGILGLIVAQVILRYLFKVPLTWSEELARYFLIWLVFVSTSSVLREGAHVRLDLSVHRLSPWLDRRLELLHGVAGLATAIFVAAGGWELMQQFSGLTTPAAGLPLHLFFAPTLVGFGLLGLAYVAHLVGVIRRSEHCRKTPA